MDKRMPTGGLLIGLVIIASLTACSQLAITSTPDVEFQDVSLSLSTINPEESLHYFEYDRSLPLDIHKLRSWRRYNVTVTELTFASPRGEPVPSLLFEPDGEGPFAGLVLMHGAPGQKENFLDWGVYYARFGFVAIAIDAPQFRSEHNIGHVSMALIWPRFEERDLEEQSQLIVDLQRAVDLLLTLDTVDPERIVYIGGSYGGAMGGLFAGVETRLKAYVLKVGDGGIMEHMSEPDERGYPKTLPRWVDILWKIEPIHFVGRAAPAELLFMNGISDTYVPTSDTLRYQQAGTQPKTIIWYNEGHFLPPRHYYDLLSWLHKRIGVNTILLKPYFSVSGFIYDRLLCLWYIISAISLLCAVWFVGVKKRLGWWATLSWLVVILFTGPIGLLVCWLVYRVDDPSAGSSRSLSALSAAVWLMTVTMLGFAVAEQVIFISVLPWQIKFLLFYTLPQITAFLALVVRQYLGGRIAIEKSRLVSFLFSYLFASTVVTICVYLLSSLLGTILLDISFPLYHPLEWFIVILSSILGAAAAYPLHLWLGRRGIPLWSLSIEQTILLDEPELSLPWYRAIGLAFGAYLVLFLIQAAYLVAFGPDTIDYFDAIKMMLGFEIGS